MHETPDPNPLGLAEAAALDALVDAGFDPSGVPPEHRAAANRVAALLGVLETPISEASPVTREALVARIRAALPAPAEDAALHHDAADAVDAWVMAAGDPTRVPSRHRPRAKALDAWAAPLTRLGPSGETWVSADRGDRVDAVLAAVERRGEAEPMRLGRGRRRLTISDAVAAASVALILSAVALPIFNATRAGQRQTVCLAHLGDTARSFAQYAGDHQDHLPVATAGFGGSWIRVGEDPSRSNSANLYTLKRAGYATLEQLACPGNDRAPVRLEPEARDWSTVDQISYSYQILPGSARPRFMLPSGSVVLTDRSPVVLNIVRGEPIQPLASSPNHRADGQHVLHLDGRVQWRPTPVLEGGDNLWLPRQIELMIHDAKSRIGLVRGSEMPASPEDAFVGP